jgi:hypothetical protein
MIKTQSGKNKVWYGKQVATYFFIIKEIYSQSTEEQLK